MLARMRRKGNPLALLVGTQTGAAALENSVEVPQKLKLELPYDPAIALLGIYPKGTGMLYRRDTCTPMFRAALSTITKLWKEPNVHRLMNKSVVYTYIYICNRVLLRHKK